MDEKLSGEEQLLVLAKVLQAIPLYFAHWESSHIARGELEQAFETLVKETLACGNDRRRFSLLLMAFFARLNNGHTAFLDDHLEQNPPLGLALRLLDEGWVVIASDLPGLRPGDLVRRLEDKPVEEWYEALYPYTVGSAQARTAQFGEARGVLFPSLLTTFLPERFALTYADAEGATHALAVDRAAPAGHAAPPATVARRLDEHLAYIKIPSFLDPAFEARAVAYVREYAEVPCLIVDVRGNGGGNTPGELIRALMDRPYHWWKESLAFNAPMLTHRTLSDYAAGLGDSVQLLRTSPPSRPSDEGYRGRLLILVDRATWSAAEDFTMPFKDNGRATIIGETTGGSSGQPFMHAFDNGMAFAVGAKRQFLPDGAAFEGVGLAPDIAVTIRRQDLYAGCDVALETAIGLAKADPPGH